MRVWTKLTDPKSPDYDESFAKSLTPGVLLAKPDLCSGFYFEESHGILIGVTTADPHNPKSEWIRIGDEVVLNGMAGGPKGTKGRVIAIFEPYKEGYTTDIFLVRLPHGIDCLKWKYFERSL